MQLDVSPTPVEGALRDAIAGQPDRSARMLLLTIYDTKYPEEGSRLRNEFGL
jgi:hypothetical protein